MTLEITRFGTSPGELEPKRSGTSGKAQIPGSHHCACGERGRNNILTETTVFWGGTGVKFHEKPSFSRETSRTSAAARGRRELVRRGRENIFVSFSLGRNDGGPYPFVVRPVTPSKRPFARASHCVHVCVRVCITDVRTND